MVFKKPYAFLIKNFKKIHLVLSALLIFLAINLYKVVKFFGDYASSGYYNTVSNIAGTHINIFMYLAVILILTISVFIYFLMNNKKKSTKYYIALIVYYIIVFILMTIAYSILAGLEKATADVQMARIYRDISFLLSLPQYFFIIYTLMRGFGFNLQKFNFQLDLKEMEIEAADNEEIELTVGVPTYKAKRYFRRSLREFRYYIMENTFIFICIITILGIILATSLFMHFNVYNKVYKENKVFTYKNFNLKVNESYITNKDFRGNIILKDKYYLVLNVNVFNKATIASSIKLSDFRIKINNENVYPTKNKMEYFTDLGMPYKEDKIKGNSTSDYLLIYELTNNQIRNNYHIKILDSIDYSVGDLNTKYKEVKIVPKNLNELDKTKSFKMNEKVSLKDSLLKDSEIVITNYEIKNTYKYNYDFCINNECKLSTDIITPDYTKESNSTLLVLDYKLNLDKDSFYYKSNKKNNLFFTHFAKIKADNKVYNVRNLTPEKLFDKIVLQVNSSIKSANSIDLLITIRNHEYSINLK